jgi:hypothetical protein
LSKLPAGALASPWIDAKVVTGLFRIEVTSNVERYSEANTAHHFRTRFGF